MSESAEKRKARYEKWKAKKRADPQFAEKQRQLEKAVRKKYEAKKRFQRESEGKVKSGKPGRIVALCGWMHW